MRLPGYGLDRVGAREREVVVSVLDVRFGEDADAAELARLSGAVPGSQHHLRSDEGAGAAERRLPADTHHHHHHGGMGIPVDVPVGDERGAVPAAFAHRPGATADQQCADEEHANEYTRCHGSPWIGIAGGRSVGRLPAGVKQRGQIREVLSPRVRSRLRAACTGRRSPGRL